MALAFSSEDKSAPVEALLAELGATPESLCLSIDARDEMLTFLVDACEGDRDRALFQYFRSGASIADALTQVLRWRFGDADRIAKALDFASGYGRVTRFLLRELPPDRVWVADVYSDGVRFQQDHFGVHGLVSTLRPEDFGCGERFDAILVTSLFTHLPAARFEAWLRVLLELLEPGGMLAFSAHSPAVLPAGVEMPADGFYFQETSESGTLATSDYGSTWVTEEFVRACLEGLGREVSVHRCERGLCNFQDLYLVLPEAGADFSSLCFHGEPQLFLERAEPADGRWHLEGWAAVRSGAVREVEVVLDGARLASAPVCEPRADVAEFLGGDRFLGSGWACSFAVPAAASRASAILLLRAIDARGVAHPVWAGSLEAAELTSWRNEAARFQGAIRAAEEALEAERARAKAEAEALRAQIGAMEASRFWKLRNAWFRLKERLGLVEQTG